MILDEILSFGKKIDASDAHLIPGNLPRFRANKNLVNQKEGGILSQDKIKDIISEIKNPIYVDKEGNKYRFSINKSNGNISLHIRFLKNTFSINQLGLPRVVSEFSSYRDGIIIVSGPSNSGRSTTASCIIKKICEDRSVNIATLQHTEYLEDGIKFEKPDDIIHQDTDVCFLEDLIKPIFKLASSGKLVIATVLNFSTLGVILNLVKGSNENYKAHLLSQHLRAIINQRLIPGIDGKMKLAYEILLPTPEIRKSIKHMDLDMIPGFIKKNQAKDGIISINQSILSLLLKRKIELKDAFGITPDLEDLDTLLKQSGI